MARSISRHTASRSAHSTQSYVLLLLGVICLLAALLLHLNPFTYPIGLFLLGLGMLIAVAFNPYRLAIAGIMVTLVGIAIFFAFKPLIPYSGGLLIIAIGLALLGIAFMARRGYVGAGAITPAVIVIIVGLVEYGPAAHFLPANYAAAILSLWFPGIGLLLLGLVYLFIDRNRRNILVEGKGERELLPQE